MQQALSAFGAALIFTSGSAIFGIFNSGRATATVFDEDSLVTLPATTFARPPRCPRCAFRWCSCLPPAWCSA
jgi:hypothetical protein